MHWRRLNLNELNGELKSLGGFSACFSLSRVGPVPRNKNKTNHQPPTANQHTHPTRSAPDKQDLFRPVFGGRQHFFFLALSPSRLSLGGAAKPKTQLSPWSSDMLSCQ